ncbi:MAG: DUF1289 domain-containing protein [Gammaproteobacteria bacterium]|nr:DUF1289 domain-containing protein [Gammaproteobacteria bacterium]
MLKIESPCIRDCCLDDNDICMGCNRTLDEIKDWLSLNDTQKLTILINCKERQITKTVGKLQGKY